MACLNPTSLSVTSSWEENLVKCNLTPETISETGFEQSLLRNWFECGYSLLLARSRYFHTLQLQGIVANLEMAQVLASKLTASHLVGNIWILSREN